MGKQNWGRLGKRFLKKCLKRQFLGKKRAFEAVFQNSDLPLTPSFVGSNPATPATDAIYCVFLMIKPQNMASLFGFIHSYPANCGVICGVKILSDGSGKLLQWVIYFLRFAQQVLIGIVRVTSVYGRGFYVLVKGVSCP